MTDATQDNPNKLYVGNLPYSVTEEELGQMYAQYGQVTSAKLIIDKMSGRSKGFGFVEFSNAQEAQAALEATNGMDMNGRPLMVKVARPFVPRERSQGFGGGGGGFDRRPRYDRNDRRGGDRYHN